MEDTSLISVTELEARVAEDTHLKQFCGVWKSEDKNY